VVTRLRRAQVRHDLVAVKVEVDPVLTGAAFGAPQKVPIKRSGLCQRGDRKSQVEWLHGVVCLKSKKAILHQTLLGLRAFA
jgi:hypothetical protein